MVYFGHDHLLMYKLELLERCELWMSMKLTMIHEWWFIGWRAGDHGWSFVVFISWRVCVDVSRRWWSMLFISSLSHRCTYVNLCSCQSDACDADSVWTLELHIRQLVTNSVYVCSGTHFKNFLLTYFFRYTVAEWYGAGLATVRSWVGIPFVAAAYQRQLSVLSLRGENWE